MKTWKLFWVCVFVGVMSSGFLTACGKGGDDSSSRSNLSYGSVNSDGTNVTSTNSTLAGMPISITISNIGRGYGGGYPSYPTYNNSNYYGGYGQSVSFQMTINGQTQNMQASTQESGFVSQIAMFYIDTAIGCYDSSCNTVLLAVIVAGSGGGYGGGYGNYEYKEIAIRKNMTNGQIEAVREFQGGTAQMVPINQLMSMM